MLVLCGGRIERRRVDNEVASCSTRVVVQMDVNILLV